MTMDEPSLKWDVRSTIKLIVTAGRTILMRSLVRSVLEKWGLKLNHLKPWTLLGKAQDGKCPECACQHEPHLPHNNESLFYQYRFFDQHGVWPTWADAMAHCTEDRIKLWTIELEKLGRKVGERSVK